MLPLRQAAENAEASSAEDVEAESLIGSLVDVFDADLKLLRRIQELDTVLGPGTVIDLDGGAVRLDAEPVAFDVQTSDDLPGLSPALRVLVVVRDHLARQVRHHRLRSIIELERACEPRIVVRGNCCSPQCTADRCEDHECAEPLTSVHIQAQVSRTGGGGIPHRRVTQRSQP